MATPKLTLVLVSTLLVACPSPEDRAQSAREAAQNAAREAAQNAIERGEREQALSALDDLRRSRADTPEALLEFVALLVGAGEAPEAIWLLEEGLRKHPERHDLRVALARTALLVNDPTLARRVAEEVPEESEHRPAAVLARAQAEIALGSTERALQLLEEAERTYPELVQLRITRISALSRAGRREDARAALDAAKRAAESSEFRQLLRRLDVALLVAQSGEEEQRDAALAGLRALIDEDPSDVSAWHGWLQALSRAGRREEGLEHLQSAIDADPDRLGLYPLRAQLQLIAGETAETEAGLREYVERSASPAAHLVLANFYAARGDEDDALAVYGEAIRAFPEDATLSRSLAEALISFGRPQEARAEFARFRELAPDDRRMIEYLRARLELDEGDADGAARRLARLIPDFDVGATQYWLGRALEAQGDLAGAERRYGLALIRDPREPHAYRTAIELARRRGDWRSVISYAELALRNLPGMHDAWVALTTALLRLGESAEAEQAARAGIRVFPDRPELRLLLARSLRARGRSSDALEVLAEIGERPGSDELEAERALAFASGGQLERGIEIAQRALQAHPESPTLHTALAVLHFGLGDANKGDQAIERALELDADDPTPLRIRAEFRAATGRLAGARGDCERYLQIRPEDPYVNFILGVVHAEAGRPEEAIAAYRQAARADSHAFAPRNNLAELLAEQGDLDGALDAAQEAFALAEDNALVMATLGSLYLRKGLVERSVSLLEEAHTKAPDRPDVQLELALAYREAGETDGARRLLSDLRSSKDAEVRAQADEALRSLPRGHDPRADMLEALP